MYKFIHKHWNLILLIIFILGIGWIFLSASPSGNATEGSISAPHSGFLAPSFSLQGLDGKLYTLSDFRGQAVLINFWASWCPPCRAEMPDMQKVFDSYHDQGFTILSINSTTQDTEANVIQFVQSYNLNFPVLFDNAGYATQAYQITALPTSFFLDREGIIQEVIVGGPIPEATLRKNIEMLLDGN